MNRALTVTYFGCRILYLMLIFDRIFGKIYLTYV